MTKRRLPPRRVASPGRSLVFPGGLNEEGLQRLIAEYLWRCWPSVLWWHTPNGGGRSAREGKTFKDLGVVPGVPDLSILGVGGRMIFLELKTERGRLQKSQVNFMRRAEARGALCFVVRSLEEMMELMGRLQGEGLLGL